MDRRRRLLLMNNVRAKASGGGTPAPTLISLNTASGSTAGGTVVIATGTNLTGASAVSVGGNPATAVSALDASHVQFTTPAGSAGAASITVTTPGGTSAPLVGAFTYVAAPTLVSLDVSSGPDAGGTAVVGTGTDLSNVSAVTVGGVAATGVSSTSSTVNFTTPAGVAGAADVVVTTPGGTFTLRGGITYYAVIALLSGSATVGPAANGGTSGAVDMSLATLLAAGIGWGATPALSDNSSNLWVKRTAESTVFSSAQMGYVANPTVTAAQTFTLGPNGVSGSAIFSGFRGVALASPYDTEAAGGNVTNGSNVQPGSVTPNEDGALLLATCTIEKTQLATITVDSGFTIIGYTNHDGGTGADGVVWAYKVQTVAGAENPKFSWTNQTANAAATLAVFRPFTGSVPILTKISSQWGTNAGGQVVTITGFNLSGATVTVDGNAGTGVSTTPTSITFTVPASAKVNAAVDVLVTNNGHTVGAGNGWYRYMAARTTTYLSTDFESGLPGAPFSTFADAGSSVAITAAKSHSGTHSLLCTGETTSNYAQASITDGTNAPLNNTNGVYLSWWQYTPDTTVAATQGASAQIKMHYDRNTGPGQPGWLMGVFGSSANLYGSSTQAAFVVDDGLLPIAGGGGPELGDAAGWIHFELYYNRKAGIGNAILAADGQILFNTSNAVLGDDTSSDVYGPTLGIAYQQNTTGETTVYLDDLDYADGF